MGHGFGELGHFRGLIFHGLSPLEQKPFYGALQKGIPNFGRRIKLKYLLIGVPFVSTYYHFYTGREKHKELQRKDPAEFENDV